VGRAATLMVLALGCVPAVNSHDGAVPTDLDDCFKDLTPPSGKFVEVQSLATTDGSIVVRRARMPGDGVAVGETFPYVLVRFGAVEKEVPRCITEASHMTYRYGHHNWNDSMEASAGPVTYRLEEKLMIGPPSTWFFTLTILEGGTPRAGPYVVNDQGCYTVPYDLNGCVLRRRMTAP
jgi:hypothetical protein